MQFAPPLSKDILTGISQIDELKARFSRAKPNSAERLKKLLQDARLRSVAAACRLSGLRRSDEEIAALLNGGWAHPDDGRHACGYLAAVEARFDSARPLCADDLRQLNGLAVDAGKPSPWRAGPLMREAFDAQGRATGRVYSTLPPRSIEERMHELIRWLEDELANPGRHPIPTIAVFMLGFLAASPFETANGRTAFALINHLLRRCGYEHVDYGSVEVQIEKLRDEFQASFDSSQTRFWSGDAELEPWVGFFVRVLDRQRERVELKLAIEQREEELPPLQQAILETVREHGMVGAGQLIEATGANRNTLKDNLRRLVERGALERRGERRAAKYRLAE